MKNPLLILLPILIMLAPGCGPSYSSESYSERLSREWQEEQSRKHERMHRQVQEDLDNAMREMEDMQRESRERNAREMEALINSVKKK